MNKKNILIFSGIILVIGICVSILLFVFLGINKGKEYDVDKSNLKTPDLQIIDLKSNTRPVAVMINNHNYARPNHAGLQDAYMVYEMIVEGGITRMMALFKDQSTEKIGSVRSSRHNFLDYALENDAIYVHFGWSQKAKSDIASLKVNNLNGLYDSGFWRDKTLKVPTEHTAFTNISKIMAAAKGKKYRTTSEATPVLKYKVWPVNIGDFEDTIIADEVKIPYSNYMTTSYVYDRETMVYKRYANGKAHTDAITKKQYTAKNIIVINVKNYSIDSYGRQNLDNIGTGKGYFITNGYARPITWSKESRTAKTVYKYTDGNEIVVNDGNTYVQIQPIDKKTTFKNNNA